MLISPLTHFFLVISPRPCRSTATLEHGRHPQQCLRPVACRYRISGSCHCGKNLRNRSEQRRRLWRRLWWSHSFPELCCGNRFLDCPPMWFASNSFHPNFQSLRLDPPAALKSFKIVEPCQVSSVLVSLENSIKRTGMGSHKRNIKQHRKKGMPRTTDKMSISYT